MPSPVKRPSVQASTVIDGMPVPEDPSLFFYVRHNPASEKTPLIIELFRKKNKTEDIVMSFAVLLGFRKTVANEEQIIEAAKELLVTAARVEEFEGIMQPEAKK